MDEWNALPWWVSVAYIEGLKDQGILKDPNGQAPASSGRYGAPVDYADGLGLPRGFTTRRAG